MTNPQTRRRSVYALVLAVSLSLAACSPSETTDSTAPGTTAAPGTTGADNTVEVTLVDYAFNGLPGSVAPGTQLTVVNDSDAEMHELVAFLLPEGEERPVAELAALPEAELGPLLGEPVTVLLAAPGGEQISAVGDGTLTDPGRYAIFCFIPTGVDPQEYLDAAAAAEGGPPDIEGGPPHFVNGMIAELTVG